MSQTKQYEFKVWLILFSFLFYLALSLCAYLEAWNSFKIFSTRNVPTNIFNSFTSSKSQNKYFSSKICDYNIKMEGLRQLGRSLAAVLASDPLKRQLLLETLLTPSVTSSIISLNYFCITLWPTTSGSYVTHRRLHAPKVSLCANRGFSDTS